jgi:hypothetical protein
MLEQLFDLVKQNAGAAVLNNSAIPNEKNSLAINSIADGIFSGLQKEANGKGFGGLLTMLSQGTGSNKQITNSVQQYVVGALTSKTGLSNGVAGNVASQIVPSVLNMLSKNTADKNNKGFDLSSVLASLTSGKTSGLNISSLLDQNGDGKLDLNDLMAVAGGSKQKGGGLLGMLSGFLGKK